MRGGVKGIVHRARGVQGPGSRVQRGHTFGGASSAMEADDRRDHANAAEALVLVPAAMLDRDECRRSRRSSVVCMLSVDSQRFISASEGARTSSTSSSANVWIWTPLPAMKGTDGAYRTGGTVQVARCQVEGE